MSVGSLRLVCFVCDSNSIRSSCVNSGKSVTFPKSELRSISCYSVKDFASGLICVSAILISTRDTASAFVLCLPYLYLSTNISPFSTSIGISVCNLV